MGLCLGLAACASPELPDLRPTLFAALDASAFPAAPSLLSGFAAGDRDPQLRAGDAALIGLELSSGEDERRLLGLFEVGSPDVPDLLFATLTWFSAAGERLDGHRVPLDPKLVSEEQDRLGPIPSLVMTSVRELLREDPALRDLVYSIPDRPGLLDVLFGAGSELAVDTHVENGTLRPAGVAPDQPIRRATAHVLWGELPVARAELLVVPPLGPFAVPSGVVGAVVSSPTDSGRRITLRLLANRRGG